MKYKILFYLINIVFNLYIYLHIIQLNIIIVNKSYFKNTLLIQCQPPPLEKFLYPPLLIVSNIILYITDFLYILQIALIDLYCLTISH